MASGVVTRLMKDKGFGFIRQDGEKNSDLFFHQSALINLEFGALREGDPVTFLIGRSPKGPRAEDVRVTGS